VEPARDRPRPHLRSSAAALTLSLALAALTACSAASGSDSSTAGGKSASSTATVSAAPPGKYRVLPEPCGAVSASTLKSLVPDASDYAGEAELTYDTDRRVGCGWTGRTDEGNRYLHVDFLRVVSYDTAVSDETQATTDYDEKMTTAGIESTTASASATATASATASATVSGSPSASTTTSTSPSASPSAYLPRTLDGLGDNAYIDDVLTTRDSGVHRDITLVFRKANVLVTVEYSQWSTDNSVIPTSPDLQDGARKVAAELAHQLDQ